MCVVSMTGDFFQKRWTEPEHHDWFQKIIYDPMSVPIDEFNKLKEEVKLMKELLKKSKEYDEKNGEPDCQIDEKIDFLRKIAKVFDIDLDEILVKKK